MNRWALGWRRRALVALAAGWAALTPGVAVAHGTVADGTNYQSVVRDAGAFGLQWEVIGGDSLLSLTNDTGTDVVVLGYDREPYLRFVPGEGVYENLRSPATYYNRDRYASTPLPAAADAEAEPDWTLVGRADHYSWHDHRIHWMSPLLPTSVNADAGVRSKIFDWTIPIEVGGAPLLAEGQLWWVPPPSWVPTASLWLVGLLLPVLVAARRTSPVGTVWRPLGRVAAVLLWTVLALTLVRLVDDMAASPPGGNPWAPFVSGLLVVAVAAGLVTRTWKGHAGGFVALGVAGAMVAWRFWDDTWLQLRSSGLLTTLAPAVRRALVAPGVVVLAPLAVALLGAATNYGRYLRMHPGHLAAKLRLVRGR